MDGQALHQQAVLNPQHVDAVPQRFVAARPVEQDVVAVVQRRRHRVALDADDRQGLGARSGQCPQPAIVEGEIGMAPLARAARRGRPTRGPGPASPAPGRCSAARSRRTAEQGFGNAEIARQLAPFVLLESSWRPPADVLLNVGGFFPRKRERPAKSSPRSAHRRSSAFRGSFGMVNP